MVSESAAVFDFDQQPHWGFSWRGPATRLHQVRLQKHTALSATQCNNLQLDAFIPHRRGAPVFVHSRLHSQATVLQLQQHTSGHEHRTLDFEQLLDL